MSRVNQDQRRGLEKLISKRDREFIVHCDGSQKFRFENGSELFLLGISIGIGTCSDVHGVNIAVFGIAKPPAPAKCFQPVSCRVAALLGNCYTNQDLLVKREVKKLKIQKYSRDLIIFRLTKRNAWYTAAI